MYKYLCALGRKPVQTYLQLLFLLPDLLHMITPLVPGSKDLAVHHLQHRLVRRVFKVCALSVCVCVCSVCVHMCV